VTGTDRLLVRLPSEGLVVLLTNDDGIDSPGLFELKRALDPLGDVRVIAPDRNRTGAARSITMRAPLWVEEVPLPDGSIAHATDGTPVDCVRLAALGFLERLPHLIVSGVNLSGNLGDDVTYSGTVAAAFEGIMLGIPSVAVSADGYHEGYDLRVPAYVTRRLVELVLAHGFPADTLLNVNCPDLAWERLACMRVTTLGKRIYGDRVQLQESHGPRRRYFVYGDDLSYHHEVGTDFDAVGDGCVSVTPMHFDLTARDALRTVEGWDLKLGGEPPWGLGSSAWVVPGGEEPPAGLEGATAAAAALRGESGRAPLVPRPDVVIFDLDGTVLDSVELIVESFGWAVRDVLGREMTRADAIKNVGRPLLEQMAEIDPERAEELVTSYRTFNHREHDRRVRLFPGMADLLLRLRAQGAHLALVTSKSRYTTEMAFKVTGVGELFEAVLCAGETVEHKPHPEPLIRVMELLRATPDRAVYVGDSPYDLQAAVGAGVPAVAVTWGVFPAEDLIAEAPDRLAHSMAELATILGADGEPGGGGDGR
jgi:5'-nucleotidase